MSYKVLECCITRKTSGWKYYGRQWTGNNWYDMNGVESYSYDLCRFKLWLKVKMMGPYYRYELK